MGKIIKKKKWKKKIIIPITVGLSLFIVGVVILLYVNIHGLESKLEIKLKGDNKVILEVGSQYKEKGSKASYNHQNITKNIKIKGKVNQNKLGTYQLIYQIKHKKIKKEIIREVKVIDKTPPEITLTGDEQTNLTIGTVYQELGYKAVDNYDGDLTSKVKIENNIDKDKLGEYEVKYIVEDKSKNKTEKIRKVKVINKTVSTLSTSRGGVAVLNYHFFYDSSKGENCTDGNCEDIVEFRKQLNYLKDNQFKALTMKEFRDWMYGEITIPEKSVLITIDDGAMGTGRHNGNKLIPILEEYKIHATLFLITGWWDIENYRSNYLDIESHTNDMHTERVCEGVIRGAKMLCLSNEEVLQDLKASIEKTKSHLGFCFPFYAYDDNSMNLVKQAGFDLAFIGGARKTTKSTDKYHIPRYQIKRNTTLEQFIQYVN